MLETDHGQVLAGRGSHFDPEVALTGRAGAMGRVLVVPAARTRPPYLMTDMIAAEPAVGSGSPGGATTRSRQTIPFQRCGWIRDAAGGSQPITTTGCGTSEHAAMAATHLLGNAIDAGHAHLVRCRQALDLARDPAGRRPGDRRFARGRDVGHERGARHAPDGLAHGRRSSTVSDRSPGASPGRAGGRDAGAGPELVPHGRVSLPDRRAALRWPRHWPVERLDGARCARCSRSRSMSRTPRRWLQALAGSSG